MASKKITFLGFAHGEGDGKYRGPNTPPEGIAKGKSWEITDAISEKDGKVVKTGEAIVEAMVKDYADCGPLDADGKPTPAFSAGK